jgi:ribosomal protein L35
MKAKTRSSASKRFKITKNKVLVQKASRNHLLVNKSKRAKRVDTQTAPESHKTHIKRLLPNG